MNTTPLILICGLLCCTIKTYAQSNPEQGKKLVQLLQTQRTSNVQVSSHIKHIARTDTIHFSGSLQTDSAGRLVVQESPSRIWVCGKNWIIETETQQKKVKQHTEAAQIADDLHHLARYCHPSLSPDYLKILTTAKAQVTYFTLFSGSMYHLYYQNGSEMEDSYFIFNNQGQLVKRINTSAGANRVAGSDSFEYIVNEYTYQ